MGSSEPLQEAALVAQSVAYTAFVEEAGFVEVVVAQSVACTGFVAVVVVAFVVAASAKVGCTAVAFPVAVVEGQERGSRFETWWQRWAAHLKRCPPQTTHPC